MNVKPWRVVKDDHCVMLTYKTLPSYACSDGVRFPGWETVFSPELTRQEKLYPNLLYITVSIDRALQLLLLAPTSCSWCSLTALTVAHGKSSSSHSGKGGRSTLQISILSRQRSNNGSSSGNKNSSRTDIQPHVPSRVRWRYLYIYPGLSYMSRNVARNNGYRTHHSTYSVFGTRRAGGRTPPVYCHSAHAEWACGQ
jgi:hypothetical protein